MSALVQRMKRNHWAEVAGKDFKDRREMGLDLI